jgi:hypothetical protein
LLNVFAFVELANKNGDIKNCSTMGCRAIDNDDNNNNNNNETINYAMYAQL